MRMRNSRWKESEWTIVVAIGPGYIQSICSIVVKLQYIAHRDHLFWGEATYCQSQIEGMCPTVKKGKELPENSNIINQRTPRINCGIHRSTWQKECDRQER